MVVKAFILDLPNDDSKAIEAAKELFNDPSFRRDVTMIKANIGELKKSIALLEE